MNVAALEKLFELYVSQLPEDDHDERFTSSRGFAQAYVPDFLNWLRRNSELAKGVQVAVVLEVTRPCGCVDTLSGKQATEREYARRASSKCYQCQLKERKQVREGGVR